MSYDLHFFRHRLGMTASEIYTILHSEEAKAEDFNEQIDVRKVADLLLGLSVGLQEIAVDFASLADQMGVTVDDARRQIDYVELSSADPNTVPLQVEVGPVMVTLALAYTDYSPGMVAAVRETWDGVVPALIGLELVGYDPQLERELTVLSFGPVMDAISEVGDSPSVEVNPIP